jgi:hypothetical protein
MRRSTYPTPETTKAASPDNAYRLPFGAYTMRAAQFEQLDEETATELLCARLRLLTAAGSDPLTAVLLAARVEIAIEEAIRLANRTGSARPA